MERYGPIDILINNAGVVSGKYFDELNSDDVRRTFEVNSLAHFLTSKLAIEGIENSGSGELHIVNIASVAGMVGKCLYMIIFQQ